MYRSSLHFLFLACVVVCIAGCGGAFDATAQGVVTLDGQKLSRGWVGFHPVAGGPPATATIGESGSYEVFTGREQGLPSGEYQVTVTANEPPAQMYGKDGGPAASGKLITPPWYQSKAVSGLKFVVEPGSNDIDLNLTTTPPVGWKPGKRAGS